MISGRAQLYPTREVAMPRSTISLSLAVVVCLISGACGGGGGGSSSTTRLVGSGGTSGSSSGAPGASGPLLAAATAITPGQIQRDQLFQWQGQYANRTDGLYGIYAATLTAQ